MTELSKQYSVTSAKLERVVIKKVQNDLKRVDTALTIYIYLNSFNDLIQFFVVLHGFENVYGFAIVSISWHTPEKSEYINIL